MTREEKRKFLAETLRSKGITMSIHGCGCCGSPLVEVEVDGNKVIDEEDFNFDMFKNRYG